MNLQHTVANLRRLAELRAREVERLEAEQARRQALVERSRHSLHRMRQLLEEVGRQSAGCPVMASNSAHYKASLVDMIAAQRRTLASQEMELEAGRRTLQEATLRRERVQRTLQDKQAELGRELARSDQKRQDQLALQSWVHANRYSAAY